MAPRRSTFALESPPKKKGASNDSEVEEFLQEGEVLTDITKNKWKLGKSIGAGGFGKIYLGQYSTFFTFAPNKIHQQPNHPLMKGSKSSRLAHFPFSLFVGLVCKGP